MPRDRELRLGTRGSQLALWQADAVAARIADSGGPTCRRVIVKTTGDRLQDAPLSEAGGKRLFVKELEDALLRDEIDLAVHSSKDMPVVLPDGLRIAGVLPRDDPRDAVVLPVGPRVAARGSDAPTVENEETLRSALRQALTVGTSSVRRVAQLMRILPDARFAAIRGNLDTRLRKLDEGQYDALILAAAGLRRLGFGSRISFPLPVTTCVPAPGQGIVAVEIRADDRHAQSAVAPISDRLAEAALAAERAVVAGLGGGCQTPIGALALPFGEMLQLVAVVVSLDGARALRTEATGQAGDAESLGAQAAERLVEQGANEILAESRVH